MKSRWLFVVFEFLTIDFVVRLKSAVRTVEGLDPGWPCRYCAATPAVCGVAIEVPLIVFVAVSLEYQADVIEEPGAKMSVHDP